MYKNVSIILIMASAIAAILIVPSAVLRALARAVGYCQHHPEDPQRRALWGWISCTHVERQPSRRRQELGGASGIA